MKTLDIHVAKNTLVHSKPKKLDKDTPNPRTIMKTRNKNPKLWNPNLTTLRLRNPGTRKGKSKRLESPSSHVPIDHWCREMLTIRPSILDAQPITRKSKRENKPVNKANPIAPKLGKYAQEDERKASKVYGYDPPTSAVSDFFAGEGSARERET